MASLGIIKGVTESILGVGEVPVTCVHQQSYLIIVIVGTPLQSAIFKFVVHQYSTIMSYTNNIAKSTIIPDIEHMLKYLLPNSGGIAAFTRFFI